MYIFSIIVMWHCIYIHKSTQYRVIGSICLEEKWYIHRNGREIVTDFYLVLILAQRFDKVLFMMGTHCILELFIFSTSNIVMYTILPVEG